MVDLNSKKPVSVFQEVTVKGLNGQSKTLQVKIDTGALTTSIDQSVAAELGLLRESNVILEKPIKSALGIQVRKIVGIEYQMAGSTINSRASISDRSKLRFPMIIGRRDLKPFLIYYEPKNEADDTR